MRHFTRTEDLTNKEYLEILRRTKIFDEGIARGENFTHLCPGKVIATEFFQESTRTSASLQAAMVKLGGGWFGISGIKGTYLETGEEDLEDTLYGVAPLADIMAIRHKTLDLTKFAGEGFPLPLINAMCGGTEHSIAAVGFFYTVKKYFPNLSKVKMGIYGMTKSSRPAKAYLKVLSRFKVTFYEDPVVPELATPEEIKKIVKKNGAKHITDKLENFIDQVDVLLVVEGLPQAGEDPKVVDKFNENFVPINKKHLTKVRKDAIISVGEPRATTDGRLVALKETDNDPRMIEKEMCKNMVYTNMALITYLLNIKIK